jgi:hypothetical protein
MASFNNIKIINSEYRTCIVCKKRALFHKWVHIKNLIGQEYEVGIVEYENGQVEEVTPNNIKFCDDKLNNSSFAKED